MYTINFTLKQHTPIIHFQHEQDGATLRATEVKPKLDRFIIEKLTGIKGKSAFDKFKENPEWKKWLVGNGEHPALNYKMKIQEKNNDETLFLPLALEQNNPEKKIAIATSLSININNIIAPTLYFANEDKIKFNQNAIDRTRSKLNEVALAKQSNSGISLEIITLSKEISGEIEKHIVSFFLQTNFGTRQNKGFGSFTISKMNGVAQEINTRMFPPGTFKKSINGNANTRINTIFKIIKEEYQLLKSGINHGVYNKSKLFEYFVNLPNPIRWEKRKIKQEFNSNKAAKFYGIDLTKRNEPIDIVDATGSDYNSFTDKQTNNYQYIRALLGLAEQIEFQVGNPVDRGNKMVAKIDGSAVGLERFQSPITFKVINNDIYLIPNNSFVAIYGKTVTITLKLKNGGTPHSFNIDIPSSFDIDAFLINSLNSTWTKI
ncbi:MAG TPA: hypothetical protein PKW80_10125 [Bacteroidales bacterium]|nr:hypothetical protein [Bacteroidales bacterium]